MSDDYLEGDGDEELHPFGLVMPFVPVKSKGGPFDDDAYAAGWECGQIAEILRATAETASELDECDRLKLPVRTANVEQLDLVAMSYGYMIDQREPWEDGSEWTFVRFTKTAER